MIVVLKEETIKYLQKIQENTIKELEEINKSLNVS